MNIVADVPLKCRANERNQVYLKWRANERRAELVRAMPSAADIMKLPSRRQSYAKIVQGERNQVYLNCRAAANLIKNARSRCST